MAVPIWKDKFVNLGTYASRYFRIQVGGTTIYSGKAVRAASSGNLYVRINDICADFMAAVPAPVPNSGIAQVTFPMSFVVQKSTNGSSWSTVETVAFDDNWSYDPSFDPSSQGMSFPITGRFDLRQTIYQTRYASGSVACSCKYGSTSRSITRNLDTGSAYTALGAALSHAGVGRISFPCATYKTYSSKTLTSVTIGLTTYTVTSACPRYVLYYKNPFGGFDHLLIEGTGYKNGSVSRDTLVADWDNNYQGREEWNYQNEVTDSWTLNSGPLTSDESERMPYLLNSPSVFLVDLNDISTSIPVIVATDSYSCHTVKSNGLKMVNHTIQVRSAQKKYRR